MNRAEQTISNKHLLNVLREIQEQEVNKKLGYVKYYKKNGNKKQQDYEEITISLINDLFFTIQKRFGIENID